MEVHMLRHTPEMRTDIYLMIQEMENITMYIQTKIIVDIRSMVVDIRNKEIISKVY